METSWAATQDFWKHLVVVEATVLGLTVGFIAAQDRAPTWILAASWVFLLLAIAAGCLLLKVGIDFNFDNTLRMFRFQSDVAGIMSRVEEGELDQKSEEFQGLFVAASFQAPPGAVSQQIFTPKAKELAAKYAAKLPTSPLFNIPKRTPLAQWCHARWQLVESAFYLFSVLAFVLLLASAVVRAPRPTSPDGTLPLPATSAGTALEGATATPLQTPAQDTTTAMDTTATK